MFKRIFYPLIGLLILGLRVVSGQQILTEHTLKLNADTLRPPARIEDLSWIAGHWSGEALGGWSEEIWSEPVAGSMLGMYRLIREERPVFYELMTLMEDKGSLVLRIKHFDPDLVGWEEKTETVDFNLVALSKDKAFFDGLTFQKSKKDELLIYLAFKQSDGSYREEIFRYRLVDRK